MGQPLARALGIVSTVFLTACSSCGKIVDESDAGDAATDSATDGYVCHVGDTFPCADGGCQEPEGCELLLRPDGSVIQWGCSQHDVVACDGGCDTCACAYPGYPEFSDAESHCQMRNGHTYFISPGGP